MKRIIQWGSSLRLHAEIWLWRQGWGMLLLASVAVLAIAACLVSLHIDSRSQQVNLRITELQSTLMAATRPSPAQTPAITPDQQTLVTLYRTAYSQDDVNRILRQLYSLGAQHQLDLRQTDFQQETRGFGGLVQHQLTLPIQARYPQLKSFVLQMLRNFPGLSFDQIVIKRESVALDRAEVTLKLSIWVRPDTPGTTIPEQIPGAGN